MRSSSGPTTQFVAHLPRRGQPDCHRRSNGAIAQVATATGRLVQRTDVAAADVATQLAATDVFLIYGQEQASDATLNQLGQDWPAP